MSQFTLQITSFTPPSLPPQPTPPPGPRARDNYDIKSPLFASPALPTTPLSFTISLPNASKKPKDPLSPATHLQLTYVYPGVGEMFIAEVITSADLVPTSEKGVYKIVGRPEDIPRLKVTEGHGTDAEVQVRARRREQILGTWTVGTVEKLGFEGFKSNDLSRLRVRAEQERREKAKAKAK